MYGYPQQFRHHQSGTDNQMQSWYHPSYAAPQAHHQMPTTNGYNVMMSGGQEQDQQQFWHHHQQAAAAHHVFNHHVQFQEYIHHHQHLAAGDTDVGINQLPSPAVTVSGSDMSSPGGHGTSSPTPNNNNNNNNSLNARSINRSPYEWIRKTNYQTQPNPGKTRTKDKYRVVYTDHQRVELEKEFYYSRYITIRRKAELASNLGLSERQVKIWFQNRRAKERKQVKKREEFNQKENPLGAMQMTHNGVTPTAGLLQQQQQQQQQQHHHQHQQQPPPQISVVPII